MKYVIGLVIILGGLGALAFGIWKNVCAAELVGIGLVVFGAIVSFPKELGPKE